MEEGSGNTVTDDSGHGHILHLTNFNFDASSGWSSNVPPSNNSGSSSLHFDGVDDFASPAASPDFNLTSAFSLEAWINADNPQLTTDQGIISKWTGGNGYMMWLNPSGKIVNVINGFTTPVSNDDLRDNNWHHTAIVWDGTNRFIYIDGLLKFSSNISAPPDVIDPTLVLGNYLDSSGPKNFKGYIDEVRIYDLAKTQSEIVTDAAKTAPTPTPSSTPTPTITPTPTPTETPTPTMTPTSTPTPTPTSPPVGSLIGYWPIEEATGSAVPDVSGNHHDLTISGTANWMLDAPFTSFTDTRSLSLDGATFASSTDGSSALCPQSGYTIESWVKASSGAGGDEGIVGNYQNGGYLLYGFDHSASTPLGGAFNGIISSIKAITPTRDKGWHHLSLTWDGVNVKVYIDGTEENSQVHTESPNCMTGSNFAISGYGLPLSHLFTGQVDEVRLYNGARSAAEIVSDAGIIAGTFPTPTPTPTITPTSTNTPPGP